MMLEFVPYFTKGKPVDELIKFETRNVEIINDKGEVIFSAQVEVPTTWSDNAARIVASKYFKIIDGEPETSVRGMFLRVVSAIYKKGLEAGYFDDSQGHVFANELMYILYNQLAFFNSPVWFNIGVPGRRQCPSACFLLGVEDHLASIYDWIKCEALIFQAGSGAGINLSNLRGANMPLATGGTASGPLSFAMVSDTSAKVVKSGAVARRAAKMVILNVGHPDIEEFIQCKVHEEKKAQALITAGYSSGVDGEAASSVFFQNMNMSVRVTDAFMERAGEDGTAEHALLHKIAQAAWECGDPGLQFQDTIDYWHTIPQSGPNTTSNPCGEFLSTDWSSCNLASINLQKINDWKTIRHVVDVMITAMDILVELGEYPVERIEEVTKRQRQLGLGYSGLGAYFMSCAIPYDSVAARQLAAEITAIMTGEAYAQSARIAAVKGPFADYRKNETEMMWAINHHYRKVKEREFDPIVSKLWGDAITLGTQHGFRNATTTCIAPTGTIAIAMDCESTGIEPLFDLWTRKHLVGGGFLEFAPRCVEAGTLQHECIDEPSESSDHCSYLETACGQFPIRPMAHVEMLEAVQPFISMGISKTVNLPKSATVEDILDVYYKAWTKRIKCISVYRDGSKISQPLEAKHKPTELPLSQRRKLPATRVALTHHFSVAGYDGYAIAGLYEDGDPGEVFIVCNKEGSTISGLLDSWGAAISFNLQYGVPLEFLCQKFKGVSFDPAGFTNNPDIPTAKSIIDYVAQWLELEFITKKQAEPVEHKPVQSGSLCSTCGSVMLQSGTCMTCSQCGTTSGACG